jgi:hypothetical protein
MGAVLGGLSERLRAENQARGADVKLPSSNHAWFSATFSSRWVRAGLGVLLVGTILFFSLRPEMTLDGAGSDVAPTSRSGDVQGGLPTVDPEADPRDRGRMADRKGEPKSGAGEDAPSPFEELRSLVRSVAAKGHLEEAMRLAREGTGAGTDRTLLFADIFMSSAISAEELLKRYRELKDENERMGAELGFGEPGRFGLPGNILSIDYEKEGLSNALMMSLAGYAGFSFDKSVPSELNRERAMKVLEAMGDMATRGEISKGVLSDVLKRFASEDPKVAFQFLVKSSEGIDPSTIAKIVRAQIDKRPEETIGQMVNTEGGLGGHLSTAFQEWLSKDREKALAWLAQNQGSLKSQQMNACVSAQASFEVSKGNFDKAREALDTIDDPQLKEQVGGRIWSAERDAVRKEVQRNPSAALQGIVSDQSKYASYWLEEAMSTWVSKDSEQAVAWYQENWNSLPASKAQYVAAAFAKQALNQGDPAAAHQWAELIQDEKTKNRIAAEIAKARSQK